ncbi:hypothetical protein J6590_012250 [Homalodisca vitripennis]|nr:hypothetical protein J6590_012250 [Homalodisca vitripennis]
MNGQYHIVTSVFSSEKLVTGIDLTVSKTTNERPVTHVCLFPSEQLATGIDPNFHTITIVLPSEQLVIGMSCNVRLKTTKLYHIVTRLLPSEPLITGITTSVSKITNDRPVPHSNYGVAIIAVGYWHVGFAGGGKKGEIRHMMITQHLSTLIYTRGCGSAGEHLELLRNP